MPGMIVTIKLGPQICSWSGINTLRTYEHGSATMYWKFLISAFTYTYKFFVSVIDHYLLTATFSAFTFAMAGLANIFCSHACTWGASLAKS